MEIVRIQSKGIITTCTKDKNFVYDKNKDKEIKIVKGGKK